jgi:preprotein translocase subunit SecF
MFELLGNTAIDFMRWRRYSFALSSLFAILGLVALVQISRGAANLGIDFAGGTAVQLKFEARWRLSRSAPRFRNMDWHMSSFRGRSRTIS